MHRVGTRLLQQYTGQQCVCPSPVNVNDSMRCRRASALNTHRHIRSSSGADNELASFETAVANVRLIRIAHSRRRKMRTVATHGNDANMPKMCTCFAPLYGR